MSKLHLVPDVIIGICETLASNTASSNEKLNALVRLDAIQEHINASIHHYEKAKTAENRSRKK